MTELPRHWKPLIKLRPDEMYLRPEIVREAMNHYGIGEVEARRMLDEEHRKFATRSSLGCVHRETPPYAIVRWRPQGAQERAVKGTRDDGHPGRAIRREAARRGSFDP